MIKEKKGLLITRLVLLGLMCFSILLQFTPKLGKVEILHEELYSNYLSSINESSCSLELTLNKDISSGYVIVKFYDENEMYLGTKTIDFSYSIDNTVSEYSIYVNGDVEYYDISYYSFSAEPMYIFNLFAFIFLIVLIFALCCHCKTYLYKNNIILVYAGIRHHFIKVNGEIQDEHTTSMTFTPINLACTMENGDELTAIISVSNAISSVKINGKMIRPCKITEQDIKKITLKENDNDTNTND